MVITSHQMCPSPCAEENNESRLNGVDDKCKKDGLRLADACGIEQDEHSLDGKMPGAGTVGRGHEDSETADAEHKECVKGTDHRHEVEGKKGYVEVEEIACPNEDTVEQVQPKAAYVAQGENAVA